MASRLKAELEKGFPGISISLVESGGGVFEVDLDGKRIFSKKKLDRFPETGEIEEKIRAGG